MENSNNRKVGFSPMNEAEKTAFDKMMTEMQTKMNEVRMDSVRMSRDAEKASSMAYLTC